MARNKKESRRVVTRRVTRKATRRGRRVEAKTLTDATTQFETASMKTFADVSKRIAEAVAIPNYMTARDLAQLWAMAKECELITTDVRHAIENAICIAFPAAHEGKTGTRTYDADGYTVRVTRSNRHNVDTSALQALLKEFDDEETDAVVRRVFRWNAELNKAVWDAENEAVREFFSRVVTTVPAKPRITVEYRRDEQ